MKRNESITVNLSEATDLLKKAEERLSAKTSPTEIVTTTFQTKLDEKLFGGMTVRGLLKTIYNKAISDRNKANQLFDKIINKYSKAQDNSGEDKDLDPEINLMVPLSRYMQFVKNSNDQLIELARVVERFANASVPASISNNDSKEKGSAIDDDDKWKINIQSG